MIPAEVLAGSHSGSDHCDRVSPLTAHEQLEEETEWGPRGALLVTCFDFHIDI